ncbi:MAG: glycosyltransferase [Bacteroidales bacterium]|nr:glycosyltransferase [Bacteroidales bacterium]
MKRFIFVVPEEEILIDSPRNLEQKLHVSVSVTNDLTTDQRVDRTCRTLEKMGFDVLLIGRHRTTSKTLLPRSYKMHRMRLLFDKGPWFYAEYNFRLFFFLLTHKSDMLVSNDLDTLPATFLAWKTFWITGKRKNFMIHDCHEYFRGVPELVGRKRVTATWKWLEDRIFPRLKNIVAVNQSVADLYFREYGLPITILRNVPFRKTLEGKRDKTQFGIRPDQKVILYQGAVNVDRGLEEAILAMKHLKTDAVLVIAGTGDILIQLQNFAATEKIISKVRFLGQVPFQELHSITLMADVGLSIEKDIGVNYHFALPNKLMDYIQARVPVLVSPFPEMKSIVDQFQIGEFVHSHDPTTLARQLDHILNDQDQCMIYKKNTAKAADVLCWENEEKSLIELVGKAIE